MILNFFLRHIVTLKVLLCSLMLIPNFLNAQVLFKWNSANIDYSEYLSIDDCWAMSRRVIDSVDNVGDIWGGFLEFDYNARKRPYPKVVKDKVGMCLSNVDRREVTMWNHSYLSLVASLLLVKDDDEEVERLTEQWFGVRSDTSDSSIVLAIDGLILAHLNARPSRFQQADALFEKYLSSNSRFVDPVRVLALVLTRFERAMDIADTSIAEAAIEKIEYWDAQLTHEQRSSRFYNQILKPRISDAFFIKYDAQILSGLKESTLTMYRVLDSVLSSATGWSFSTADHLVRVDEIKGDYLFQGNGSSTSSCHDMSPFKGGLPTPGKNSLVMLISGADYCRYGNCWKQFVVLNRLKQLYPNVEVVIVSGTRGFFQRLEPLSPEQESQKQCEHLLDFHKINGYLVVYNRPFFKLPGYDRRRIDDYDPNLQNFNEGGRSKGEFHRYSGYLRFILIDKEGYIVVNEEDLTGRRENRVRRMLSILERGS